MDSAPNGLHSVALEQLPLSLNSGTESECMHTSATVELPLIIQTLGPVKAS